MFTLKQPQLLGFGQEKKGAENLQHAPEWLLVIKKTCWESSYAKWLDHHFVRILPIHGFCTYLTKSENFQSKGLLTTNLCCCAQEPWKQLLSSKTITSQWLSLNYDSQNVAPLETLHWLDLVPKKLCETRPFLHWTVAHLSKFHQSCELVSFGAPGNQCRVQSIK